MPNQSKHAATGFCFILPLLQSQAHWQSLLPPGQTWAHIPRKSFDQIGEGNSYIPKTEQEICFPGAVAPAQ